MRKERSRLGNSPQIRSELRSLHQHTDARRENIVIAPAGNGLLGPNLHGASSLNNKISMSA